MTPFSARIALPGCISRFPPTAIRIGQGSEGARETELLHVMAPPRASVRFPATVKMPLADPSASSAEPSRLDTDSGALIRRGLSSRP